MGQLNLKRLAEPVASCCQGSLKGSCSVSETGNAAAAPEKDQKN